MNLEESNSFMQEEQKREKKKKVVMVSMILCFILMMFLIVLIGMIQYQDSKTLKMFIDGTQVKISPSLYKEIEGKKYVNIKEMAELLGYHYTQGEYNQYNENEESCYIANDYEIVAFTAEEKVFTKYAEDLTGKMTIAEIPVTVKTKPGQSQKYSLDSEIKLIDGVIYVPFEGEIATDLFNIILDWSQKYRIRIYTINQVVASSKNTIARLNYTSMSGDYENLKAMLYGLAVIGDGSKYGVVSLKDGKEILGIKYEDITFISNSRDFLIKAGNTVGIVSSEGKIIIKPTEYDDISVYDDQTQLYLVKKDNKYGILNRLGKVIIYPDYDSIGYEYYESGNKKKEYKLIFDKCIPVKEDNKYRLYSIDGKQLLLCVYDSFGSKLSADSSNDEEPLLEIPSDLGIKGIVIKQNDMYGLYDVVKGAIIIPCSCTKVYSTTRTAQTTYYIEHAGMQYNLNEYLEALDLKSLNTDGTVKDLTQTDVVVEQ